MCGGAPSAPAPPQRLPEAPQPPPMTRTTSVGKMSGRNQQRGFLIPISGESIIGLGGASGRARESLNKDKSTILGG